MDFVSEDMIKKIITPDIMRDAIAGAFLSFHAGKAEIFDVIRGRGSEADHRFNIKSGREDRLGYIGVKAGSYTPQNIARGIKAHSSNVILFDALTGRMKAVVEASYLNGYRTAAANALATDKLARADAATLGVIGAGPQAFHEAVAVSRVRALTKITLANRSGTIDADYIQRLQTATGAEVIAGTAQQAAANDIVATVTPSLSPVLETDWIAPGTHISAMGADGPGKNELPINLFAKAETYVDVPVQAKTIGECQHAYAAGVLSDDRIDRYTLGALLAGDIEGRSGNDAITIFDSSGMALQDIAAAGLALRLARDAGLIGTRS
jgi:ornithine cyclodeaminase/alanine dehydrogenase-like protein (mu-crystallin family)